MKSKARSGVSANASKLCMDPHTNIDFHANKRMYVCTHIDQLANEIKIIK